MKQNLVRRVRQVVKRSGLSQNKFAVAHGFSVAHFSKVLSSEANVGVSTALKLQAATGISAGEFLPPKQRMLFLQQQPQPNPRNVQRGRGRLDVSHRVSQLV